MSEHSPIGWTDATWPIVGGCSYVSPGCSNCWAVRDSWRMAHNPNPRVHEAYFGTVDKTAEGKLVWSGIVRQLWNRLDWPLKWRGAKRVFVCSQSDLFHQKVSFEFIAAAFGVMAACPQHTFQVLTKHPARMLEFYRWLEKQQNGPSETCAWEAAKMVPSIRSSQYHEPAAWPLENVWPGVTVEDQARADERILILCEVPAHEVRWLSVEPLLEAVQVGLLGTLPKDKFPGYQMVHQKIRWIVVGGESAQTRKNTRAFHLDWARSILKECRDAEVPFFMKQLGTKPFDLMGKMPVSMPLPLGKNARYKFHEPEHWPADLRVQEFPA